MNDLKLLSKHEKLWSGVESWQTYIKGISTIDLIRIAKVEPYTCDYDWDIKELQTRTDIPDELKLEILLLFGG